MNYGSGGLSPPSDLEEEIFDKLAKGVLPAAQPFEYTTPVVISSPVQTCPTDYYLPESPAASDSYLQYGTPLSNRPDSRTSYSALSPGSGYLSNYGGLWDSSMVNVFFFFFVIIETKCFRRRFNI